MPQNRRTFLQNTLLAGTGLSMPANATTMAQAQSSEKLKVVCIGGHPDDPETGCGGTLAKFSQAGHQVTIVYLTTGEAGISGKGHDEAAAIRKIEALEACDILGAKPVFMGQIDGDSVINNEWAKRLREVLEYENPDLVFTHWPLDSHADHRAASMLTLQAYLEMPKKFQLFFYEVLTGAQSMGFKPTDYVDITATQDTKVKSIMAHASQGGLDMYHDFHGEMDAFRGREAGYDFAEGFVFFSSFGPARII